MLNDRERQFLSGPLAHILGRRGYAHAAPAGSGEDRF